MTSASLEGFKQRKDPTFTKLMQKEFLVFHCMIGKNRTPAMAHAYLKASGAQRNANQKVCLLLGGIDGGRKVFEENNLRMQSFLQACVGTTDS
jgi:hypothetical protein